MLFQTHQGPQHLESCKLPALPQRVIANESFVEISSAAKKACLLVHLGSRRVKRGPMRKMQWSLETLTLPRLSAEKQHSCICVKEITRRLLGIATEYLNSCDSGLAGKDCKQMAIQSLV